MIRASWLSLLGLVACGGGAAPVAPPPRAVAAVQNRPADPLGPRPELGRPAAFVPASPQTRSVGPTSIWLDARPGSGKVSFAVVLPMGSADDPRTQHGLAWFTGHMLEQGAGSRDSVAFAKALEALGADFSVDVYQDYSSLSLSVLAQQVEPAFALLADALLRPRLTAADFAREKARWIDDLDSAEKSPQSVFERGLLPLHFGDSPYGHPRNGHRRGALATSLADVKRFQQGLRARPATVVAVGDITLDGVQALLQRHLAPLTRATRPALTRAPIPSNVEPVAGDDKRVHLISIAGAPQSVIGWIGNGPRADDARAPLYGRVNAVLGGSFSSRLNQDLREERGLSYGAHSRYSFSRDEGVFVASAAVFAERTGEAMAALQADVLAYAAEGPTDEESERSRLLARGELVEAYEPSDKTAARLARLAGVGLAADADTRTASVRDAATRQELAAIAKQSYQTRSALFVVGDGPKVRPLLEQAGYRVVEVAAKR